MSRVMSAEYRPIKRIPFHSLFECDFAKYGIQIEGDRDCAVLGLIGPHGTLFATPDGNSTHYERHLGIDTDVILEALSKEFDTEMVNEDDHRFWGFATEEEMKAASQEVAQSPSRFGEMDGRHWFLAEGPSFADADFTYRWLQAAIEADRLLQLYFDENPGFRSSISRLEIAWAIQFAVSAMAFVGMWLENKSTFSLDLTSEWGEIACEMAAVGFFSQTGDRYQMTIPKCLTVNQIREALLQLASTEDAEYVLHPEWLLASTTKKEIQEWQQRLSAMPWQQRVADRDALLAE
jgi:hypothetical protein